MLERQFGRDPCFGFTVTDQVGIARAKNKERREALQSRRFKATLDGESDRIGDKFAHRRCGCVGHVRSFLRVKPPHFNLECFRF
jgi:hypothetical protein